MYTFGTLAYCCSIGLFFYFVSTSYTSALNQPFISISDNAGNCHTVPIAVTDSYMADSNGNWIGSPNFEYSESPYEVSFNNFEVSSEDQYAQMMTQFQVGLVALGEMTASQNLPQNLMFDLKSTRKKHFTTHMLYLQCLDGLHSVLLGSRSFSD